MNRYLLISLLALSSLGACGKSGERDQRPIEKIFYVTGPTGSFRVVSIEGANALHVFPGEVFTAPHYFVLENVEAPIRGTFQAIDAGLNVTLAVGQEPIRARVALPAGETITLQSDDGPPPRPDVDGHVARIEVYSSEGPTSIPFSATLGDLKNTDLTSCLIADPAGGANAISTVCSTPATFFIEDPKDFVSGIFQTFSTEGRIRADLYVDCDEALANCDEDDSDEASDDVVVQTDI